ncbi:unnamed protein product [Didymodactylos carnosus]|uniref:Peptidase S1 domain-containing protein n=1 Tax=Didymodactylos carnosus TaxID=1234261 RepID=A0A814BLC0_9BILA|nr:unnamed protein product [Didymodactylos carnosus]CAF1156514.1 unnamed protein product [Didymodactylos carnosus]CAF3707327.1 unnamed protein product [Didymodactylos carnosus]CAF3967984.1 unnamed protein product [Didymodactylos carnosus]
MIIANTFIYPSGLTESSCTNGKAWTTWFNVGHPSSTSGDREVIAIIKQMYPNQMCLAPSIIQGRATNTFSGDVQLSLQADQNGAITEFSSTTPMIDFEARYCCPTDSFEQTTTTTAAPRPIDSTTCGRSEISPLPNTRIFGGTHAIPNSWPFIVLYEERKPCDFNPAYVCTGSCGGSLIDARHVLTAAHCVNTRDPSSITITAGIHNKMIHEETRQVMQVEKIFVHSGYNNVSHPDDIAIVRLSKPVTTNKYVNTICLPGPEPEINEDVAIAGWGSEALGGQVYHQLKQAWMKVVGECERWWRIDNSKQMCIANPTEGHSACQGDSGGPVMTKRNGQWIASGVASYVADCKTHGTLAPNVYTRVSAYLPWIKNIIDNQ